MGIKQTATLLTAGLFLTFGTFAQQPAGNSNATANTNASSATGTMNSKMRSGDMKFAQDAATGGMEEVELGKIAVQKAQNDQVKQFGQKMIDDHSKAGDQLKSLAATEHITLPDQLNAKQKASVEKYSNMSGAAFDRAYITDMVKDHEKDVAEFRKEANSGSDKALKDWASSTLPTLEEHLRMAKEASKSVGQ